MSLGASVWSYGEEPYVRREVLSGCFSPERKVKRTNDM